MHDLHSNMAAVQVIAPAVQSATVTTDEIDLQGFNSCEILINTGAIVGAGNFTAKIVEATSDESPPEYSDVAADDLLGTLPSVLEANKVYRVGYRGSNRFIGVTLTKNSGTSLAAGVVVIKGHPAVAPVA